MLFDRVKRSTGRPGRKHGKDCVPHFTGAALRLIRRLVHGGRIRRLDVIVNVLIMRRIGGVMTLQFKNDRTKITPRSPSKYATRPSCTARKTVEQGVCRFYFYFILASRSRRVAPISDPAARSGVPTPGGVRGRLGWIGDRTRRLHFLSFIARSTSRLASRVLMDARRSCSFLPLANPSSTLARPRWEK